MSARTLRLAILFVAFQAGWFAIVASAARGWIWAGPALAAGLLAAFSLGIAPRARLRWLLAVALLGLVGGAADSLVSAAGLVRFAAGFHPWLAPPWIAALWSFSAVWLPNLRDLGRRPWLASALGAAGGPIAYAGGVRLGAATFPPLPQPPWPSFLAIGLVWAIALPLLLRVPILTASGEPLSGAQEGGREGAGG